MTDSSLRQTTIVVENAGCSQANGEYRLHGMHKDAGVFTRVGSYNNKEVWFSIFRYSSIRHSDSWWNLAITAANKWPPDIDSRIEWIYQSRGFSLETPPTSQWTSSNADISGCAPTMKIIKGNKRALEEAMTPIMSLYQDHECRDFTISYKGQEFPVHKCVLVSTSSYFKGMFSGEWKETISCELKAF
jgi:hypothetical protein